MSRFCRCGAKVEDRCPRCDRRPTSQSKNPYGYDWQKKRREVIEETPLCVDCKEKGRIRPAKEVHHIQGVQVAPHLRLEDSNLVPLCEECHDLRHGGRSHRVR